MSATILLVRHATPDWTRTDLRYDLPPGPPLTDVGEDEARTLGTYLREQGIRQIHASPLERSRRTAELAGDVAHALVSEELDIAEWRLGETETEVLIRCSTAWQRACDVSVTEGPIALVTHGGPIRVLLQYLGVAQPCIDFHRRQFDRDNPLPPAGAWCFVQNGTIWSGELAFAPRPYRHYAIEVKGD